MFSCVIIEGIIRLMGSEKKNIEQEFLSAYDKYADEIFRYLYFRLPEREIASDLTQETFLRAWKSIAEGKRFDNIRAFLYRVARNLSVDFYRKKKETHLEEVLGEGGDVPDEVPKKDFLEEESVHMLLRSLPEKQRDVITMRFLSELSIKEIAKATKITETLVSVRIYRGLKKLRALHEEKEKKQQRGV